MVTAPFNGTFVSNEFPTFELDAGRVLPDYLAALFRLPRLWTAAAAASKGVGDRRRRIQPDDLLSVSVRLPSIEDQATAVASLVACDARLNEAVALRTRVNKAAAMLHAAAVDHLFTMADWPHVAVENILREDTLNGLSSKPNSDPTGVPILRISAATSQPDAVVDETDHRYVSAGYDIVARYRLAPGDLVACRFNGNLHYVGRFALYEGRTPEPRLFPDKLIRFRVDPTRASPAYVRLAMNGATARRQIEAKCATTAGNIGISARDLKKIELPLPPVSVQSAVTTRVTEIRRRVATIVATQTDSRERLEDLRRAVLERAAGRSVRDNA